MTNTELLELEIKKSGLKKIHIAIQLGLSPYGLAKKINNETEFKSTEISKLREILRIEDFERFEKIFFADKVDCKSTNEARRSDDVSSS